MTIVAYAQISSSRLTGNGVAPSMLPRRGALSQDDAAKRSASASDRATAYARSLIIIDRLEVCLDEESTALEKSAAIDFTALNNQKSHGLMELNSALRAFSDGKIDEALRLRLQALRAKLNQNLRLIRRHLLAVSEVSVLVSDAIQSADSDGTYAPLPRTAGVGR